MTHEADYKCFMCHFILYKLVFCIKNYINKKTSKKHTFLDA